MPRFRYSFLGPDGAVGQGTAEAEDESSLATRVRREQGYLLNVWPERSWRHWLADFQPRFGQSSLVLALHEMGSLLRAGLTIDRALTVVAELLPDQGLRVTLLQVRDQVRRGVTLSSAFEGEPSYFKPLHINLVRAGEVGAGLDVSLLRLADHLRKQEAIRSQIQIAMIYPAILMLVGVAALVLLATVVLPQLAPIFADAGQQMPLPTRLVLASSTFLERFGWLLTVALIAITFMIRQGLRDDKRSLRWHRFQLGLPIVGQVILGVQTARFSRTTGTLLKSGVALPAALGLARQTLSNRAMSEVLRKATIEVRGGRSLTDALRELKVFPKLSMQLTSVGEESGHLDEMLLHQAELFERSTARQIEKLVAILIPSMTIVIGASVAGVLASILLAVMQLNELAN